MPTMHLKRRMRVVENCPQPDPPEARPVVYGAAPWSRLPPTPPAHEITVRARAQSILSRGGKRAELPDYPTALRIIAAHQSMPVSDHEPPAIPQEIETGHPMPAAATPRESPSRAAAAGFNHKETK